MITASLYTAKPATKPFLLSESARDDKKWLGYNVKCGPEYAQMSKLRRRILAHRPMIAVRPTRSWEVSLMAARP